MSKYQVKILGFGDNVVDMYDHLKIMYPGGNCVNVCEYAAMFGAEKAAYMGYFGTDEKADHVMNILTETGIETIKCKQIEGENGWAKVTLKDGDRVFVDWNDGGIRKTHPYVLDRFDLEYIGQFDVIHTGNYCFTEKELPKIRKKGCKISFDFSDDSDKAYYKEIAPFVDYAFCSFEGTEKETMEHLKKIVALGPEIACASRGSRGCILFDGKQFYMQPAVKLDKVVDTMGAGDSLISSFLVGYTDGIKKGVNREKVIKESLQKAAEFAAEICLLEGAFGHGTAYNE